MSTRICLAVRNEELCDTIADALKDLCEVPLRIVKSKITDYQLNQGKRKETLLIPKLLLAIPKDYLYEGIKWCLTENGVRYLMPEPDDDIRSADVIVTCVTCANLIVPSMLKSHAKVIIVGYTNLEIEQAKLMVARLQPHAWINDARRLGKICEEVASWLTNFAER